MSFIKLLHVDYKYLKIYTVLNQDSKDKIIYYLYQIINVKMLFIRLKIALYVSKLLHQLKNKLTFTSSKYNRWAIMSFLERSLKISDSFIIPFGGILVLNIKSNRFF